MKLLKDLHIGESLLNFRSLNSKVVKKNQDTV